ncbi:MAG: pyridoxal 5'-phosphate synthase glutaminase subunit PdxT [Chloroflexi bacterium]|nr:MAG: pyridoxal 5'-phosphate synthase glutaminase subunit PdxT [Chloroflexota bacterium]
MKIGVLALQGAFREHIEMLRGLGVETVEVRLPEQLRDLDGLIIPGGESTTIGKVATQYNLIEPLREFVAQGKPVWGTCAGMIVLAKEVGMAGHAVMRQPLVGVMDVRVKRNAFGRQVDSFETDLDIPEIQNGDKTPFHAIFIRAPLFETVNANVRALAKLDDGTIVAARENNLLATSFHPELTHDPRFHQYFLNMVRAARGTA